MMSRRGVGRFVLAVAAGAGASVHAQGETGAAATKNPVVATPQSVAAGKQAYLRTCASCHGTSGAGGPGNDLIPAAPSLLGDAWTRGSTDGEIFASIRNGVPPDLNMVPFKDKLKDDEIWDVVNYLRSIAIKK